MEIPFTPGVCSHISSKFLEGALGGQTVAHHSPGSECLPLPTLGAEAHFLEVLGSETASMYGAIVLA